MGQSEGSSGHRRRGHAWSVVWEPGGHSKMESQNTWSVYCYPERPARSLAQRELSCLSIWLGEVKFMETPGQGLSRSARKAGSGGGHVAQTGTPWTREARRPVPLPHTLTHMHCPTLSRWRGCVDSGMSETVTQEPQKGRFKGVGKRGTER